MFSNLPLVETVYTFPGCPGEIALLTDFHNSDPDPVLTRLQHRRPDLIAVAGDVIHGSAPKDQTLVTDREKNVLPFLKGCVSIAPTYLSLGNHEWMLCEEDLAALRNTGVTLLDNAFTYITLNGIPTVIGGLTSSSLLEYRNNASHLDVVEQSLRYPPAPHHRDSTQLPEVDWLTDFAAAPGYHILLCHQPEYFSLLPAGAELVLSGHAHGGQWRICGRGIFAPGQGFFPRWTAGIIEGRMIISRGLANTTGVPRINNPAEIVYITDGATV